MPFGSTVRIMTGWGISLRNAVTWMLPIRKNPGSLYQRYREYSIQNGEFTRQIGDFVAALENAGYNRRKTKAGKFFYGLKLKDGQDFL